MVNKNVKRRKPLDLAKAKLSSSVLTLEDAKELGIEILTSTKTKALFPKYPVPSLKLNYYDAQGAKRDEFYRVRFLEDPPPGAFGEVAEKPRRYAQPKDTTPAAYFPTNINWSEIVVDPSQTIILTEGELKAACASKHGYPTIGLGGVWSWKSNAQGWGFLPELELIEWVGRDVIIAFDSDASTNPGIAAAIASLVSELSRRGALTRVAELPVVDSFEKTGLDDFILVEGAESLAPIFEEAIADDLTNKLWEFNKKFSIVINPGMIYDEEEKIFYAIDKWKTQLFSNIWANKLMATKEGTKIKRVRVATEWLDWPLRRQFKGLTYKPGASRAVDTHILNQWCGWGCSPAKGCITPWESLLDHLFKESEPQARKWFEQWCLYPLKFPGTKLLSTAGIWSKTQGVGKSLIGVTLGRIYGKNYSLISQREFDNDFNGWAVCKQLVCVDDISSHDSRAKADVFKKVITQETMQVNQKFMPGYELPDILNYYLTSNRSNAFYIEEQDRRFFIHEVKVPRMDYKFYDDYYAWLASSGPPALFHYALNDFDFEGFSPYQPPPLTRDKLGMIQSAMSEIDLWLAELRAEPKSKLVVGQVEFTRDLWTTNELIEFFDQERKGRPCTPNVMGVRLREFFEQAAGGKTIKPNGKSERFYIVRDPGKWVKASTKELCSHIKKHRHVEQGTGKVY